MEIEDIQVNETIALNYKTIYEIIVDYNVFTFDKKEIKLFLEKFIVWASEITTRVGYLVRIKNEKICSFHKWYKRYSKNCDWNEVEIHHRNGDITDNCGSNLRVMGTWEHSDFHDNRREKNRHKARISSSYQTYKEKFFDNNPDATLQTINYFLGEI